ncbi:unnamed protein product [Tilletia controversa]|uniref:F-box domain-containing protein n=3 Tax=Tilletia TaxID=13289 RepID=A0A8X7MQK7_9BASI|nr:hypothetical protein CF336_g1771 [Tilletia laevis]KAE8204245.1 hypothetical protein CF328_g1189 [Tilletia controversa]KAE8264009.1 hypothetical protein A4X03_0g1258 [Tilletia caries]KAE8207447.1 hypothetical protein CF335_g1131 [Tilletia laevis]KAE8245845.1 hypothetical protein A4X06_0g5380 [Tilletia controversa]
MSTSLLLTALTNRLAAGSLNNGGGAQQDATPEGSEQQLTEWENISHVSDDELVDVMSLPGTAPGTPRSTSRPSSPPAGSRADGSPTKSSSRSRSVIAGGAAAVKTKSKTDPLRSLPSEVAQRIFLQLSIPSLISCSAVSKRWRRSATLNFCWFKYSQAFDPIEHVDFFLTIPPPALFQPSSSLNPADTAIRAGNSSSPTTAAAAAMWTRRESRTDWKLTFAKQVRMARRDLERPDVIGGGGILSAGGSGYSTPSRRTERLAAEGVLTNTERRQQQWSGEASSAGYSKTEMRGHYKSQGSRGGKVKGKSGKGGTRAGHDSLWE